MKPERWVEKMMKSNILIMMLTGCALAACSRSPSGNEPRAGASGAQGSAVSVVTVRAQKRDFPVQLEATGTVSALNSVDVKPQLSTGLLKVHIREGQFVKAGETLFTLDTRADEANVAKAKAQLQKDLAALADAQRQLVRSQELLAQGFVSQTAVDSNRTLVDSQKAVVDADRAAIEAARVNLSFGRITAPSSGRAGAISVYAGSYVTPATSLVTITQLDPVGVSFNLPQRNLADALEGLKSGGSPVKAELPEGRGILSGKLQFVDNAVDAQSGTVRVKAVFANAEQKLWPGAFVTVRLVAQTLRNAIVVPQSAVVQTPAGRIVFVADVNKRAAIKPVDVVASAGSEAVVTGVQEGERVVVEGRQNLRPGVPVIERAASSVPVSPASSGTQP